MDAVSHNGRTTAYRYRAGEGPVLLFVHGSGSTHDSWRRQFSNLPYPMAALDLSGHGESDDIDTPPGPATLSAYGEDVVAVSRAVEADVLVGNSLGGAVVLHVALDAPYDPAGIVLVGSGAKLTVHPDILDGLEHDFDRYLEGSGGFYDADPALVERSNETTRETGQAVTYRDFKTCDVFDVRDRLGEIDVPALAVTGEHDELTFPWYHEYLAENIPGGEYVILERAAHLSMLERPTAFNEVLSSFLERLA